MKNNNKLIDLNTSILNAINVWNSLAFTHLKRIYDSANIIVFAISVNKSNSYDFLKDINKIIKEHHPVGELVFIGHGEENYNDDIKFGASSLDTKLYKITIFLKKDLEDDEYVEKMKIFYEKIITILETHKN